MSFNIPFKYRVQIVRFEEGNKIIKNRTCFLREQDADKYFNRTKELVITGEVLVLEQRERAPRPFEEVKRYEID